MKSTAEKEQEFRLPVARLQAPDAETLAAIRQYYRSLDVALRSLGNRWRGGVIVGPPGWYGLLIQHGVIQDGEYSSLAFFHVFEDETLDGFVALDDQGRDSEGRECWIACLLNAPASEWQALAKRLSKSKDQA